MADHESKALAAAFTAWSTSTSSASTTSDSFCSVAGLIVGKRFLLCAATILPPMNNPYRGSILMWSIDSGAGAYSKVCLASSVVPLFAIAMSVDREVIAGLISASALFLDLHEHVVEQGGRTEPEPLGRHPLRSERLVQDDQVRDRLLRRADASRRLEAHGAACLADEIADCLHDHKADGQRRRGLHLACRRLDEVPARSHREYARAADAVVSPELARFEDHLQERVAARLYHGHDLLVNILELAGEERAPIEDHVHLISARGYGLFGLGDLYVEEALP